MRAVVWHGKEDVRVDEVPDPRIEQPTDAIVRITSTAICGSDLHLYGRKVVGMRSGDIIGHEPMGIVQEVGSGVTTIAPGDRVVVPFNISCGDCYMCARRLYSQCETTQNRSVRKGASLFGYTHLYGGVPGAQAEYLRVPYADVGPLKVEHGPPDERYLYLSDVLPTSWQGVEYADVPPGGDVAVFGLGPIGQMTARIALFKGAGRVIGVDRVAERLEMAKRHGVTTIDLRETKDVTNTIWELTGGRGVDSGIDCVGLEAEGSVVDHVLQTVKLQPDRLVALHQTMGSIRRGGTLSLVGVYLGMFHAFPLGDLFDKQIAIRQGQANVRRWTDEIVPLLERDDDPLAIGDLTTHRLPLEQAPHAYEIFQKKQDGAIKIVLDPA